MLILSWWFCSLAAFSLTLSLSNHKVHFKLAAMACFYCEDGRRGKTGQEEWTRLNVSQLNKASGGQRVKEKKGFLFLKTGAHEDGEGMKDGGKWREKDIAYRWATDLLSLLLLLVSWRIHATGNNKSQWGFNLMSILKLWATLLLLL